MLHGLTVFLGTGLSQDSAAYLAGSLTKDEPQAVYADDPNDCWNRIFFHLFTRTLRIRLSEDFAEGAPFSLEPGTKVSGKRVSTRLFQRIEDGDRGIEPLYPHEQFRSDVSAAQVLEEPRFSAFRQALDEALAEKATRPPLERALMQSDLWAAFDFVSRDVSDWILKDAPIPLFRSRQDTLRGLLARLIKKLALSREEIAALPANYPAAAASLKLPDLFAPNSEWLEVLTVTEREHDRAANHRRATRVFIRPAGTPRNKFELYKV